MSEAVRRPSARRASPVALAQLAAALPDAAPLAASIATRPVTHLTADSREVGPGTLFVCVRGLAVDGHRFAAQAAASGAAALLVDREVDVPGDIAVVRVSDTRVACGPLAAAFFDAPSRALDVVGITGTNGKTTTSYLVRAACEAGGRTTGVLGTVGYTLGDTVIEAPHTTPDAIHFQSLLAWLREGGAQVAACEVSSHGLALHRTDGTRFAVRVFTNLTRDHLDFHGTVDAYRDAKLRLFARDAFAGDDVAVVNLADPEGAAFVRGSGFRVLTYGTPDADIAAEDVALAPTGTSCVVRHPGGRTPLALRMAGAHNVQNALAAFAAATLLGVDAEDAARGLSALAGVPGRLESVHAGQPFAVLVDYAHTPDALERALRAVREFTPAGARVICVVGCGGDRDAGKRPIMGELAATLADIAIITSDNPRTEDPAAIVRAVLAGVPAGRHAIDLVDRRDAIRHAIAEAREGDSVLIAGKGHEDYQILGTTKIHFDDREEARAALATRGFVAEAAR